jgi:hypothetical protein
MIEPCFIIEKKQIYNLLFGFDCLIATRIQWLNGMSSYQGLVGGYKSKCDEGSGQRVASRLWCPLVVIHCVLHDARIDSTVE